jgi:hypothetical protein
VDTTGAELGLADRVRLAELVGPTDGVAHQVTPHGA